MQRVFTFCKRLLPARVVFAGHEVVGIGGEYRPHAVGGVLGVEYLAVGLGATHAEHQALAAHAQRSGRRGECDCGAVSGQAGRHEYGEETTTHEILLRPAERRGSAVRGTGIVMVPVARVPQLETG